jgi:hypothetical protein
MMLLVERHYLQQWSQFSIFRALASTVPTHIVSDLLQALLLPKTSMA